MLTKATFWHAKKRTALFRKYPPTEIIALNWRPDFMGRGGPTMDFIWNVWDSVKFQQGTEYSVADKLVWKVN